MLQHTVLITLRRIKNSGVDDSQIIHSLTYVDLDRESFINISAENTDRLGRLAECLQFVGEMRSVPTPKLRAALTPDQFTAYLDSFNYDISHAESEMEFGMPDELKHFAELVRKGDRFTALSNGFRNRGSTKRDHMGRTASARLEQRAESAYEDAGLYLIDLLEGLPGMPFDHELAHRVREWLDRDVGKTGEDSGQDSLSTARIRGSRSEYTLMSAEPMWGKRLSKYWRQREALTNATIPFLYGAEDTSSNINTHKLSEMMKKLRDKRNYKASSTAFRSI